MGRFLRLVFPVLMFSSIALACGGSTPPSPTTAAGVQSADAGASATKASTPVARPFAKTGLEATTLIDDAIESKRGAILKCVEAARARRGDARARVEFDIGIDQEGTLIGIKTPKGAKDDRALNDCLREALHDAPFPRSTAGVLTVHKGFSDELVYPK